MTPTQSKLPLLLGTLTLILFSAKPYILDLIEPAKSIGQVIGENAIDLITVMRGDKLIEAANSTRDIWSNIITIASFILLGLTIIISMVAIRDGDKKWYGIAAIILATIGLGIYFSHLAIALLGFVVVVMAVMIVFALASSDVELF